MTRAPSLRVATSPPPHPPPADLETGGEGKRRLLLIGPGDHQRVAEIDSRGMDGDARRAGAQRRCRDCLDDEALRSAERLAQHRAHLRLTPAALPRETIS